MPLPEPMPALVFRYAYLGSREIAARRERGKQRPACLIAAMNSVATLRFVAILPITHAPPGKDTIAVEGSPIDRPRWRIEWGDISEHSVDEWPNAGLAPLPGRPSVFSDGFNPHS